MNGNHVILPGMNIDYVHRNEKNREIVRGIYPILNFTPQIDAEKVLEWAIRLPEVGIRLVQVRAKLFSSDALTGFLDEVVNNLRGAGLAVILNDFIELVGPTGADGVHFGLDDFPVFEARALLGHDAIIGVTCRAYSDALLAIGQGATYVAAGCVFPSQSKPGLPLIGVDGLRDIVDRISLEAPPRPGWGRKDNVPVCAIGGITKDNLPEIHKAGSSMAAVISAIQDAADPVGAAGELVKVWEGLE